MRKLGARVIFYNVEPTVREVFRLSQLESFFQFASDRESALASIEFGSVAPIHAPLTTAAPRAAPTSNLLARSAPPGGTPPLRRLRRSTG